MLASALSGMAARIPCHPLDTMKARMQVQTLSGSAHSALFNNWADALRTTARCAAARIPGAGARAHVPAVQD